MSLNHFETYTSYVPASIELFSAPGFLISNLVISGFIIFRYFLMVLPFHFLRSNQISAGPLKPFQIRSEIKYSILSTLFFSLSGYLVALLWDLGWTQIYLKFDDFGFFYLPISFLIYGLVHEIYFYFTHVWMHKPNIFKKVHYIHHQSNPTSPWASFSFHPYEGLVHALFLPLMVLVIPIHPVVLISYLMFMTVTAIINHLGFELLPFKKLNRFFISGSHHGLHHKFYNGNYGLYFCFIDRIMNTEVKNKKEVLL